MKGWKEGDNRVAPWQEGQQEGRMAGRAKKDGGIRWKDERKDGR